MIERHKLTPAGPRLAGGLGALDDRLTTESGGLLSGVLATEIFSPMFFAA
jgi:hypothetical protein